MAPDRSSKSLWGRVKEAFSATDDEPDELSSRPQVISTFTASRLPSGGGPSLGSRLFPDEGAGDKWELYEDSWGDAGSDRRPAPPAPAAGPAADAPAVDDPAAAPRDLDDAWESPSFAPLDEAGAFAPSRSDDLSAALEQLAGDGTDSDQVFEHLDEHDVDEVARAVGFGQPEPPTDAPASSDPPATEAPDDPAGWQPSPDVDAVRPQVEGNLFAEAPGLARELLGDSAPAEPEIRPAPPFVKDDVAPRPVPAARAEPPQPPAAPDPAPVVEPAPEPPPAAEHDHPAAPMVPPPHVEPEPAAEQPAVEPATTAPPAAVEEPAPPAVDERAAGSAATPRVAVHEDKIEHASSRARVAASPAVRVHDDRLDSPAPPKEMNPSEAIALAERGRPLGPREDVGPAG